VNVRPRQALSDGDVKVTVHRLPSIAIITHQVEADHVLSASGQVNRRRVTLSRSDVDRLTPAVGRKDVEIDLAVPVRTFDTEINEHRLSLAGAKAVVEEAVADDRALQRDPVRPGGELDLGGATRSRRLDRSALGAHVRAAVTADEG